MVEIWRNGCNRTESLAIMYKPKRIWSYILLHHIKSLLYCLSMIYFSFKYIFLVAKRIELFILLFSKKNVLAKNFHLCFYHFFFLPSCQKGGGIPHIGDMSTFEIVNVKYFHLQLFIYIKIHVHAYAHAYVYIPILVQVLVHVLIECPRVPALSIDNTFSLLIHCSSSCFCS